MWMRAGMAWGMGSHAFRQAGRVALECHAKCIPTTFLPLCCGMHLIRYILVHLFFC